jgi:hypothetical protein
VRTYSPLWDRTFGTMYAANPRDEVRKGPTTRQYGLASDAVEEVTRVVCTAVVLAEWSGRMHPRELVSSIGKRRAVITCWYDCVAAGREGPGPFE